MKEALLKLVEECKSPMKVFVVYGCLANLLYYIAGITPGGGRLGAWYLLYYAGWPVSWLFTQIIGKLDGHVSDKTFDFLYVAQVIFAGMIWWSLISLMFKVWHHTDLTRR